MGSHLIENEFQSDKYPTTPRGKVPLSTKDKSCQDLLWEYAQRRRSIDAEFSEDLEAALRAKGFVPGSPYSLNEINSHPKRIRELYIQGRSIWGIEKLSLAKIIVRLGVDLGKLCRFERDATKDEQAHTQENLETAMGNVIFSMIRWCGDLGLDPESCVERAIECQEKFAKENERR